MSCMLLECFYLWDAIEMQTSNNALTSIVKTVCAVDGLCTDYNLCCKCNKIYAEGIHKFDTKWCLPCMCNWLLSDVV